MTAICKFKLNPSINNPFEIEKKYYYHVQVLENREELFKVADKLSPQDPNHNFAAIVLPFYVYRFDYDKEKDEFYSICKPKIGNVLFRKDYLNLEVISHEAVHLATNYLRLIKKLNLGDEIDENEELLAYCVGGMTQELITNFYKFGLLN